MIRLFYLIIISVSAPAILHAQTDQGTVNTGQATQFTILSLEGDLSKMPDSVLFDIYVANTNVSSSKRDLKIIRSKKDLKIRIPVEYSFTITIPVLKPLNGFKQWEMRPGDSIVVLYAQQKLVFSGKGSETLSIWNSLYEAGFKPSMEEERVTRSVTDYLAFSKKLNQEWESYTAIFESYKGRVQEPVISEMKARIIQRLETKRNVKFFNLYADYRNKGNAAMVTESQLCAIYDTTFFSSAAQWMRKQPYAFVGYRERAGFIRTQIMRKLRFPKNYESEDHVMELLEEAKRNFKGEALEAFASYALVDLIIKDMGLSEKTYPFYQAYFNELQSPKYIEYVNSSERIDAQRVFGVGNYAAFFELNGANGRQYGNKSFLGKFVLLNFNKDAQMQEILQRINSTLQFDTNLVIINVIPKNLAQSGGARNVYNLWSSDTLLLRRWALDDDPLGIRLIGQDGKIAAKPDLVHRENDLLDFLAQKLKEINEHQWNLANDGPYITGKDGLLTASYINNNVLEEKRLGKQGIFNVSVDPKRGAFMVALQNNIVKQPAVYEKPSKILAVSDIEGNFHVLRSFLLTNQVIDSSYNWTFGTGHLVFVGDMFDRGEQVTACLWLLYSLEDKARAAGGYMHFILGNHEIMNLSGDNRYADEKYLKNAALMGKNYSKDLYGSDAELGRWLRSKNIVEKVGDILFTHGGISPAVNRLLLSLEEINTLARPFYGDSKSAYTSPDKRVTLLYRDESPFWYRLYYQVDSVRVGIGSNYISKTFKTSMAAIDSILNNYNVKKIVTGHTIFKVLSTNFGENVSAHYDNKVINIDTPHAKEYSEALLIEGDRYYRVNRAGNRVPLFASDHQVLRK